MSIKLNILLTKSERKKNLLRTIGKEKKVAFSHNYLNYVLLISVFKKKIMKKKLNRKID